MFFRRIAPAIFILALAIPCTAQTLTLTENDYKRAETLLGYNANPLVLHSPARPVWLPDDRFWYRLTTERGTEFVLVDPARRARMPHSTSRSLRLRCLLQLAQTTNRSRFPSLSLLSKIV